MTFSTATSVAGRGDGSYTAEIEPGWDIFGVTNGGYLLAMTARAMGAETPGRRLASVSARFVNPSRGGSAIILTETLKTGRTISILQARTLSGDRPLLTSNASFVDERTERPAFTSSYASPPDLPPVEDCVRLLPAVDGPLPPPFMSKVEVHLHPDDAMLGQGPAGRMPEIRGWVRLMQGELFDPYGMVLASDAMPPAIFNSGLPLGWTPTIDLTVHVRDPGPHEWLACRFHTRFITGGWLEEDGEIWDSEGHLVAQSRQLALVSR
ncbi:MAG: thioesterase family protein [Acidimicrobiia bacterium]